MNVKSTEGGGGGGGGAMVLEPPPHEERAKAKQKKANPEMNRVPIVPKVLRVHANSMTRLICVKWESTCASQFAK